MNPVKKVSFCTVRIDPELNINRQFLAVDYRHRKKSIILHGENRSRIENKSLISSREIETDSATPHARTARINQESLRDRSFSVVVNLFSFFWIANSRWQSDDGPRTKRTQFESISKIEGGPTFFLLPHDIKPRYWIELNSNSNRLRFLTSD